MMVRLRISSTPSPRWTMRSVACVTIVLVTGCARFHSFNGQANGPPPPPTPPQAPWVVQRPQQPQPSTAPALEPPQPSTAPEVQGSDVSPAPSAPIAPDPEPSAPIAPDAEPSDASPDRADVTDGPAAIAPPAATAVLPSPLRIPSFRDAMPDPVLPPSAPAMEHLKLSSSQCKKALSARKLPFIRAKGARGVAIPVRIDGPIDGVEFRAPGNTSKFGILDCRLALVLADLAPILKRHGVIAIRIDNMYRPNARFKRGRKQSQHALGLAVDIFSFVFSDGVALEVEDSWPSQIGAPVCGPEVPSKGRTPSEVRLRNLACDIARHGLFHHHLTPNFDGAHRNHFHLDIKQGVRTYSIS